jgi:hypothetical protein
MSEPDWFGMTGYLDWHAESLVVTARAGEIEGSALD